MAKTISFEEKTNELKFIIDKLEKNDEPLEEMIKLYQRGMKTLSDCYKILEKAELKITDITEKVAKETDNGL